MRKKEILVLNIIPLWEAVVAFLVMLVLTYNITEYVISPLTRRNTTMQTQLIIFLMTVVILLLLVVQRKRNKKLYINFLDNKANIKINENSVIVQKQDMRLLLFLHKRFEIYTLRVNNSLYLMNDDFLGSKNKKKDIEEYRYKIKRIKEFIGKNSKRRNIDYIPIIINVMFYLLMIVGFLSFITIFIPFFY